MRALAIAVTMFCGVLTVPGSVLAQDRPIGEVAGGYSFMRDLQVKENFPAAWFASYAHNITDWLAAVGEIGGSYKSYEFTVDSVPFTTSTRLHTLLAGPRYSRPMGAGAAFVQVLGGGVWESGGVAIIRESLISDNPTFAIQPGAGIDIPLTNRLSARLGADYRLIFADRRTTEEKNSNEFRIAAGLVVGLGAR
jgi:hypothetical protein